MIKTAKDKSLSSSPFQSGQNGVIKILALRNGYVCMGMMPRTTDVRFYSYQLFNFVFQDISHKGKDKEKGKSPNLVSEH